MRENIDWKSAFFASPGPKSWFGFLKLFSKGLAMGSADIVPGVSGGTIAFITGIYEQLINAIRSFDLIFLKLLLQFKIKKALTHIHFRFLLFLFLGIFIAIISLARLISYLLSFYPVYTWSVFFGLILASIILIGIKIDKFKASGGVGVLLGALVAYYVIGLIPFDTPNTYLFIFLSGVAAIIAMILPGISGAFILLLLGKYQFMVQVLRNPFIFENQIVIFFFVSGCLVGIFIFSRLFSFLFDRCHDFAISVLTGFVLGSLRKIWPWKETTEAKLIDNQTHIISEKNILPDFNYVFFLQIFLILFSFFFVLYMHHKSKQKKLKTIQHFPSCQ